MNNIYKASVLLTGIFFLFGELYAQDYSNNSKVSERINSLIKTYPSLVKAKSLVKTKTCLSRFSYSSTCKGSSILLS
jgi:hypothetical protein